MGKITKKLQREREYWKARKIIVSAFQDYTLHFYSAFANEYANARKHPRMDELVASMLSHNGTPVTATHLNRFFKDKYYSLSGDIRSFNSWNAQELYPWLTDDGIILRDRKHRTRQMLQKKLLPPCKVHMSYGLFHNRIIRRNCILNDPAN